MSQWYNLIEATPYKEPWKSNYGGMNQTFFCKIEGVEESVMINKQAGNTPKLGAIYGSLEVKPGKDYLKFNGEKMPEGESIPQYDAPAPQQSSGTWARQEQSPKDQFDMPAWFIPYGNMIEQLHRAQFPDDKSSFDLKDLGEKEEISIPEDEPMTDEEKAKLDDIFGPTEEVEVE